MKVILDYDPENHEDLEKVRIISKAFKNDAIVDNLYDVFVRPYYKHGFDDCKVNQILENLGEDGAYLMEYFKNKINELIEE